MLGINDPFIYWGYLLSIICLIICIWYGAKNWNKGGINDEETLQRDLEWEKKEEERNNVV